MKYLTMSRHVAVASFVAASLVLSACGGGGGDDTTAAVESELSKARDEAVRLQGELDDANERIGDATQPDSLLGMIATQTARANGLQNQLDDANGRIGSEDDPNSLLGRLAAEQEKATGLQNQLTGLQNQLNAANDLIGTAEDSDSLRGMIADLNEQLNEANDQIGSADDPDSLLGRLATEQKKATDLEIELNGAKQMIGSADQKAEPDEDGNFPDGTSLYAQLNYYIKAVKDAEDEAKRLAAENLAKEKTAMAKSVLAAIGTNAVLEINPDAPSVTLKATSAGVLTATNEGYARSDTNPDVISGWRGAELTKGDDTIVIYTDIDNAVATELDDIYRKSSDPGEPIEYSVVETPGADDDIPYSAVTRANMLATITGSGATQKTTFVGDVSGVAGTFSCTGTTCEAPSVADGALTGWAGTWAFVPDDPNGTIDVDDPRYLAFGWSLTKTATGYDFDAFTSQTGMTANTGQGNALEGGATYKGGAAGKYAMVSTTEDSAEGGHFTASVTLTANFDADSDGNGANDEEGVSISGMVNNFMTGEVSRDSWSVELAAVDTTPGTDGLQLATQVGPITNGVATWKTGGAVDGMGEWTADFYGEDDDDHPTDITGEFDAAIGGGDIARISGAFGASKPDDGE